MDLWNWSISWSSDVQIVFDKLKVDFVFFAMVPHNPHIHIRCCSTRITCVAEGFQMCCEHQSLDNPLYGKSLRGVMMLCDPNLMKIMRYDCIFGGDAKSSSSAARCEDETLYEFVGTFHEVPTW